MAKYSDIKGFTVQTVSTDPAASAAASGSWASGGDLNTGRNEGGGAGIQTAALMFGGRSPSFQDLTESYNGTSWTEVNDMSSPVAYLQSAGVVYTAALGIGGHRTTAATANNESWDGTNWTEVADLNSARSFGGSNGSATSALIYGGVDPTYPPQTAKTESWDGSSWTETGDLNTAREGMVGFGFNNSNAISAGGSGTPTAVESFDGSSWTEIAEINTGRTAAGAFGAYNDGIVCGGSPGDTVNTEAWNGTAWTEVNNLANGRNALDSGIGSPSQLGIVFGGYSSSTYRAFTEEWSFPSGPHLNEGDLFLSGGTSLKGFGKAAGIPAATWSSGGSLNTGRFGLGAAGSQTANLVFAGGIPSPPQTNITESYNGTSWTEVNDMQRSTAVYLAGTGTQTAALGMAGENTTVRLSVVESWDGTNWTEIADVNTARGTAGAAGTQTAAFLVGGDASPGAFAGTELWNGSSWTEVNNLNTARNGINATMGTQTEALVAGGYQHRTVVESWDGTSWTETTDINTGRGYSGGSGSQTFALVSGGQKSPSNTASANTEFWNGSSWTEVNDLSTARMYVGGSPTGSAASALITGGHPPYYTSTEEWTADATLSTVTVS